MPNDVLEIGTGSGIVKNCLRPLVKNYVVLDINPKLKPDLVGDVRAYQSGLENNCDCVIIADVLEHLPFCDFEKSLKHIYSYLKREGKLLMTIPHRRSHFLFMTPMQIGPWVFTVPTGFLSLAAFYRRFIRRKIWIDPHHCWEIGDGKIKKVDVERLFKKNGFMIDKFKKLLYVDFWVLKKEVIIDE
jgi:predicted SAM-dependent methyltransferase